MKPQLLLAYQLLAGCMDTATGLLLILAPVLTTHLMQLHVAAEALPFLSFVGAFVLSVGIAYLYGAWLVTRMYFAQKLEVIWLLTAITRACVAMFILGNLFTGRLETGWATVAITDGALALLQTIGLSKGWLTNAA